MPYLVGMVLADSRNLLRHSFYQRWLDGTLSSEELRDYAGQYAFVVAGLPGWLRRAAVHAPQGASALRRHANEEDGHLELWQGFASALGSRDAEPNSTVRGLLVQADELSDGPVGIAVAWAVESQSATVSREKLTGLEQHYDLGPKAGEYFRLHATRDLAHVSELETVITCFDQAEVKRAQQVVDIIQNGLWDLLTSVETAA